jgi:hypothetical protein
MPAERTARTDGAEMRGDGAAMTTTRWYAHARVLATTRCRAFSRQHSRALRPSTREQGSQPASDRQGPDKTAREADRTVAVKEADMYIGGGIILLILIIIVIVLLLRR